MTLFSWLRKQTSARARRGANRIRPHRVQIGLEELENRTVPSTLWTVTNNLDTGVKGDGSLRGEIAAANPGDTINFAPSLNGQTITLTSGELLLNKSLTIDGPGAGQLTISGGLTWRVILGQMIPIIGNSSRVFEVTDPGTNVTLSGLTITDGFGGYNPGEGGAILNTNLSTLTVSGCTVSNSLAALGGGICNDGATALNLVNSTLSGNIADDGNGGGEGGGLYSLGSPTVSITDCTLSGNTATFEGGGVWMVSTTMTVKGCTLSGNSAGNLGSAIYNGATAKMLTIKDSVFSGNTSIYGPIVGPWTNKGGNTFS
jgi:hypothetical protein